VLRRTFDIALLFALLFAPNLARAKELDQFSDRLLVLSYYAGGYRHIAGAPGPREVDTVLDDKMNALLDALALLLLERAASTEAQRDGLVRDVFQHPLLPELVTPYEEWVKNEAPVPLYKVTNKGIYGHTVDYDDMRMTWYIEASPIIQVSGVLIGLDKLGHFIAQGFQYYTYNQSIAPGTAERARYDAVRREADDQERHQLGYATGGVFSYADLAANWEGMLFFMSLFADTQVEGARHARFFERAADGHYRRVREFHWSEWISSDWDEALNPSLAESAVLYQKVRQNFARRSGDQPSICDDYHRDPNAFFGPRQPLRPRERYTLQPGPAGHPIDVRALCAP
jgi:hypothetical protein